MRARRSRVAEGLAEAQALTMCITKGFSGGARQVIMNTAHRWSVLSS